MKTSVFGARKRQLRVDGSRIRRKSLRFRKNPATSGRGLNILRISASNVLKVFLNIVSVSIGCTCTVAKANGKAEARIRFAM